MKTLDACNTFLGIELGSTRIKAVLIDREATPVASGSYTWENRFENGYWTYSLDEIHKGITACFADLASNVQKSYGVPLTRMGAIGISGMMHGYLAFDSDGNLLTPFRTWRNTTTAEASRKLTELFHFHIPQRWSIAHFYQAILDGEQHVRQVAHLTTLAGYIHYLLTGNYELGIGEASGMFPIRNGDYDADMVETFDVLLEEKGYSQRLQELLPRVRTAGERGAVLTPAGARFLDPSGNLQSGIPLCPPEGDAGTGMVATNSVLPLTGNVSAGTSIFAMLVLDHPLQKIYSEIDIVTTPDGSPVAMVHCNNGCSELDAWVKLFLQFAERIGSPIDPSIAYETLFRAALEGDADCGGVSACNFLSGEHIVGIEKGHPLYFRNATSRMELPNFMRAQLYAVLATLRTGMDILLEQEAIKPSLFYAHGGFFKTSVVGQSILADALRTPISVMETAGEGGAWGMALLASYMIHANGLSLGEWLNTEIFHTRMASIVSPDPAGANGFAAYLNTFQSALAAEKALEERSCSKN